MLESGEYFIRADFDDGYGVAPYYLHAWSCPSDFISTPDVHVSWNSCSPIYGHPYWHCAEVWRVERDSSTKTYKITVSKTHRNKAERIVHVGKSLQIWISKGNNIERGDCYLCVSASRYSLLLLRFIDALRYDFFNVFQLILCVELKANVSGPLRNIKVAFVYF